jgi:hypothetical protein
MAPGSSIRFDNRGQVLRCKIGNCAERVTPPPASSPNTASAPPASKKPRRSVPANASLVSSCSATASATTHRSPRARLDRSSRYHHPSTRSSPHSKRQSRPPTAGHRYTLRRSPPTAAATTPHQPPRPRRDARTQDLTPVIHCARTGTAVSRFPGSFRFGRARLPARPYGPPLRADRASDKPQPGRCLRATGVQANAVVAEAAAR